jgi:transcriptional regulator with PAS, ATPase and Fis domain
MAALYHQMASIAGTELPVLLGGETGVGKELLARTVHLSSPRAGGPFVAVNCAAIPAELLEAEMFGIGKGVATGVEARPGRFRQAHGGTLFLDEIGDLPLPLQAKLLRALESKEVHPVGSAPQAVDVRLVAASNADLRRAAAGGSFREDLYYRLAGCVLEVPPLRRRREDLPVLVERFVAAAAEEAGKAVRGVSWSALECLSAYPWPGNVRELQHEVRRLVHLCPAGGVVDSTLLPPRLVAGAAAPPVDEAAGGPDAEASLRLEDHVVPLERRLVREALRRAGGNRSEAARLLGMSRNGLAYKLKTLGLDD